MDAGASLDEAQDILGHASASSTSVYVHPDLARLRAAVDRVPSPRELVETIR
jgi:site-specific recombinase XerD